MADPERVYALLVELKGDVGAVREAIGGLRADAITNTAARIQHDKRIGALERRESRAIGWAAGAAAVVSTLYAIGSTWIKSRVG